MDICLWDKCNNRCVMCTNPDGPWEAWDGSFDYDYDSLEKRVLKDKAKFLADDTIYLTGGEPTIHPEFLRFMDFLVTEFPQKRIILLTNGRRFIYGKFCRDLLGRCPNLEVHVSLYGHNQAIHEAVTRSGGSYDQSVAGIGNLLKHRLPGQVIALRHVLSSLSCPYLSDFLALAKTSFPTLDSVILMFWEIEAQAEKNISELLLRYSEAKKHISAAADCICRDGNIKLYHFPLCQLDEELWPLAWCTWPADEVTYLPACDACSVKKYCVGIHRAYLKNIGSAEFTPITREKDVKESGNIYQPIAAVE